MKRMIAAAFLLVSISFCPHLLFAQDATYSSTEYQIATRLKTDRRVLPPIATSLLAFRNLAGLTSVLSSSDWMYLMPEVYKEKNPDAIVLPKGFIGTITEISLVHGLSGNFLALRLAPLASGEPLWTTYGILDATLSCKLIQIYNLSPCAAVAPVSK
jgi:hypothetical protein